MIPTVDLAAWRAGDPAVAPAVDEALQEAGFLLVTGHGVDDALRAGLRSAARRFFALPAEVKQRYAVRIGGRGWLAPGVEANGNADAFGAGLPTSKAATTRPTSKSRSRSVRTPRPVTRPSTTSGSRPTPGRWRFRSCTRPRSGISRR